MRTPLSLLALVLCPLLARAATPPPAAKETEVQPKGRYRTAPQTSWYGDIVAMKNISLVDDLGKPGDLCMIPPASDYVLRALKIKGQIADPAIPAADSLSLPGGKKSKVETAPNGESVAKEYFHLVWHATVGTQSRNHVQAGSYISLCGLARERAPGDLKLMQDDYITHCTRDVWPADDDPRLYSSKGGVLTSVITALRETLEKLLSVTDEETLIDAMKATHAVSFRYIYGGTIKKILEDRGRSEKVRIQAAESLALNTPTALSGQVLAKVWQDESESLPLRLAAMRAFAFVISYGDYHTKTGNGKYLLPTGDPLAVALPKGAPTPATPKFMSQALASYLKGPYGLIAINAAENDETGGDPAKLSELGRLAYCAAISYDKGVRDEALGRKKMSGSDKDLPGRSAKNGGG